MSVSKNKLSVLRSLRLPQLPILHRYILGQFLLSLVICLLISTSLFVVFDFFEKVRLFVKEDTTILQAVSYLLYKVPWVIHRMTPVAVLIATLLTIGRLSQNSEITAMRASGVSLFWLAKPLLGSGMVLSLFVFLWGETIVPWSTRRVDEIYQLDIKKKVEKGTYSRSNFWYRSKNYFYEVGYYDSRTSTLDDFSIYEFGNNFDLIRREDAKKVAWHPAVGWSMRDVVETTYTPDLKMSVSTFDKLPLVIPERPSDFYNIKTNPETLSFRALWKYIEKLKADGVPVVSYLVDLHSKISLAFVSFIVVLIAFPFGLIPARSGTMTLSFVAGVSIGFGYHFVHAFCSSLGSAELIPVIPAAWAANILLGSIGGYLMAGSEFS